MKGSLDILNSHLNRKRIQNKRFSNGVFARELGISPNFLSEILNGKKKIPHKRVDRFIEVLDLDTYSANDLKLSLASETVGEFDQQSKGQTENFESIEDSDLYIVDQWFLVPMMELIECGNCIHSSFWIGEQLGISEQEAKDGINGLMEKGYIQFLDGKFSKTKKKIRLPTKKSLFQIRQHHRKMIRKSIDELMYHTSDQDFDNRLICGITIAAKKANIEKARKRLNDALHEVAGLLMDGEPDTVIQLNTQLFSLLKRIPNN